MSGNFNEAKAALQNATIHLNEEDLKRAPDLLTLLTSLKHLIAGIDDNPSLDWEEKEFQEMPDLEEMKLVSFSGLAMSYFSKGKIQEAKELFAKAPELRKQLPCEQRLPQIFYYSSLSVSCMMEGLLVEGEAASKQVLSHLTEVAGEGSPFAAQVYFYLSYCRMLEMRLYEAEELMLRCLQLIVKPLGEDRITVVCSYTVLAQIYSMQNRFSDAEALLEIIPNISRQTGAFSKESNYLLAMKYTQQGKFTEAQSLYERVLVEVRKSHGETSPAAMYIELNLGDQLIKTGR